MAVGNRCSLVKKPKVKVAFKFIVIVKIFFWTYTSWFWLLSSSGCLRVKMDVKFCLDVERLMQLTETSLRWLHMMFRFSGWLPPVWFGQDAVHGLAGFTFTWWQGSHERKLEAPHLFICHAVLIHPYFSRFLPSTWLSYFYTYVWCFRFWVLRSLGFKYFEKAHKVRSIEKL